MASRIAHRTPGAISQATVTREVKPVLSATSAEARKRVLVAYKKWQRYVPEFHLRYNPGRSIEEVRNAIKKQFLQNAHVTDPRIIDLLVHKAEIEWFNTTMNYNQSCHIFSKLFADSVESKPKDFLGKFFAGQN